LGVPVVDADLVAREVVRPGEPALAEIAARFGASVLTPDGHLDRARLRGLVFSDPGARRELEAILHPRIRARMFAAALASAAPYCLLAIPLLVEGGLDEQLDRVLVVDLSVEEQRRRLALRDGSTQREIDGVLAAQATREDRLAAADDVIDNGGHPEALQPQIEALHARYLELAAQRANAME
ncbi:MAG: dephospho-CoA kinase, partial [Pseudomonadota bacterium]